MTEDAMAEPLLIAVVEIPKGARNKYEYDPELGGITFDRLLMSAAAYPLTTATSPTPSAVTVMSWTRSSV